MKRSIRTYITSVVLGAAMLAGCATTPQGELEIKVQQPIGQKRIYSSPKIRPEWGFKIINKTGDVDESRQEYIEGDDLYIVGFSKTFSSERDARADAYRDAVLKAYKLTGEGSGMYPVRIEVTTVTKDGKTGYVVETLTKREIGPNDPVREMINNR